MAEAFRIGIAGLGTVGTGVIKIIQQHGSLIAKRAGRPIEIVAVSARSKGKDRGVDLSSYDWVDNAADIGLRDDLDAVVELIGGQDGDAKALAENALGKGISLVTANKALLAHHGFALAKMAEDNNAALMYEAAVAGGIPIIKSLREGFAANKMSAVYGILNGTCNYILTEMRETGRPFDEVLKEAQDQGYAEADPTFDIEGIDAAHKLCLLSALAFGVQPDFETLEITGISKISATNIAFAQELGYKIKLLGVSRRLNGKLVQTVEPCLVPEDSTIGAVEGVYNAVYVEGDYVDTGLAVGRGAGEGPTASSVVADIIDLARGYNIPAFGVDTASLAKADWASAGDVVSKFYVHMRVIDKPGVLADITAILKEYQVSMEVVLQRGRDPDKPVSFVMTTHESKRADVQKAIDKISALESVVNEPRLLRIETFTN